MNTIEPGPGTTTLTVEEKIKSSYLKPTISSQEQRPQTVHPVQLAQTEESGLVIEGLGILETLVSSETLSSAFTFTTYKTVLLTTVLTSMVCTCCNTLSFCELMFLIHFPDRLIVNSAFNYSEFDESLPIYTFSL